MESPVQRYKLTIAYRGTAYHGWQHQTAASTWKGPMPREGQGIPTVQQTLKHSLEHVMRHPVTVVGASRTDSGVHAKGQVAHFDSIRLGMPTEGMRRALNHDLPDDVIVRAIEAVPPEFDAIRSTTSKRYQYLLWNDVDRPVFFGDLAWHRWQPLDVPAMQAAAGDFIGTHDFTSFARPGHKRETTIRTVTDCTISHRGPRLVVAVEGTGFLWHMVRIMVGTLVEIGLGLRGAADVPPMLAALDRRAAGQTAPPHGLYLQWIRTSP